MTDKYNTHFKYMFESERSEIGTFLFFKITNGDLVSECLFPFEERPPLTGKYQLYQFGKITRAEFDKLPSPLIPIHSPRAPIS